MRIERVTGEPSTHVAGFLEREWDAYHRAQGHDTSVDWSPRPVHFVVHDDSGRIAGVASGRISAGIGHLSGLMVAEGVREQGVGSRLPDAFEASCRDAGCHKLTLHTDYGGAADRFYRKRGWEEEAIFRRDRGGRDFVRLYKFFDD